jgi:sterol desaturase/sphingolipid hydroxylase (fatty acid hydroxylase superfamily)
LHDWRVWAIGFLFVEFAYYWFHRISHRVAWLWASHSVHHSAEQLTLLSSLRLGWTNALSGGWLFYLPLVFAGFDPRMVTALLLFDLHYQFFLHTEAVGRLGVLEWIFNTPAHHRVHHASNAPYLDRNYGGVLIILDRLFGTLAVERSEEPLRYGLAQRAGSRNPIRLAFEEWSRLFRAMRAAKGLRARLDLAFAAPGDE